MARRASGPSFLLGLGGFMVLGLLLFTDRLAGPGWWAVLVVLGVGLTVTGFVLGACSDAEEEERGRAEQALPPGVPIDTAPPGWPAPGEPARHRGPGETLPHPGAAQPWAPPPREPVATAAPGAVVQSAAFHPTQPHLAQGLAGGDVALWDVAAGGQPSLATVLRAGTAARDDDLTAVAFHPSGALLATGGVGLLWDLRPPAGPRPVARLIPPGYRDAVLAVAFSPDGRLLATSSDRGQLVRLWDVTTPTGPRPIASLARPPRRGNVGWLWRPGGGSSSTRPPAAVAFHPWRPLLAASAYSWSGHQTVRLWDLATRPWPTRLADVPLYPWSRWSNAEYWPAVHGLAFSADGALLATASEAGGIASGQYGSTRWREAEVGLWAAGTAGRPRRTFGLRERGILDVAVRHACRRGRGLAADAVSRTLSGHSAPARATAFHPTRPLLATAGDDSATLLWDVTVADRLRLVEAFPQDGPSHSLAFPAGGHLLAVTGPTATTFWPVP